MRILIGLLFAGSLVAQFSGGGIQPVTSLPATCAVTQVFNFAGTLYTCPHGVPVSSGGGGGGSGTVTTSGSPTTGTLPLFSGPTVIGNSSVSDNGTLVITPEVFSGLGLITGSGAATSGFQLFGGATSGSSGFSVANAAGTSILYLLPTSPTSANQFWQDSGAATCPTLPAGSPTTCHQLIGAAASGTTPALVQISQQILASPAATVTFSSIPGTYSNLLLTIEGTCTASLTQDDVYMQYNGDTGANYQRAYVFNGSAGNTTAAAKVGVATISCATATANSTGSYDVKINSYARTSHMKNAVTSGVLMGSSSTIDTLFQGQVWSGTPAAITSIVLGMLTSGNTFAANCVFTLYGQQ